MESVINIHSSEGLKPKREEVKDILFSGKFWFLCLTNKTPPPINLRFY